MQQHFFPYFLFCLIIKILYSQTFSHTVQYACKPQSK